MSNARKLADNLPREGQLSGRNLIINGGQQVWQRATATTTITNSSYPTVDRFRCYTGGATYTSTRSTDVPSGQGFSYSNKFDVATPDNALGAGSFYVFKTRLEGSTCMPLCYGTSDAKTITLSFWVKSNKTGTYSISLYKFDGTSYTYVKNYTINTANTWEKKIITITPTAGNTTFITSSAGQIANDNSHGLDINFILSVGSNHTGGTDDSWSSNLNHYATSSNVNWMDNASNNFYITGVQLEVGSQATPFEHEPYDVTLRKCQRYFYLETPTSTDSSGRLGVSSHSTTVVFDHTLPIQMRTKPSLSLTSASLRIGDTVSQGFTTSSGTVAQNTYSGTQSITYILGGFSGLTTYRTYLHEPDSASPGMVKFDAEL